MRALLLVSLALALPLCGCGGSSNNEDDDFLTLTAFLGAEGGFEGTIDAGGAISEPTGGLGVGDREGQVPAGPVRAFLSFDISGIPANATLTVARLRCTQGFVSGTPYSSLGSVVVDHMNYGATFPGSSTYGANALLGNIGTLSADASLALKTCSVLIAVNADRTASRTRSQFRLRWTNAEQNFDGQDSFARFVDAEGTGGMGGVPLLEVTYQIPN
jgi:hypothetical protein